MATVTDPIILDSTGQDIVTALGNLNTPRDTAAYTTSFASSDTDDASATSWTVVSPIAGGETHATLFGKLSQIAKNVRYLYKTLGNTDLSAIGDGTVTGAIMYRSTIKKETISLTAESTTYILVPSGILPNTISFLPTNGIVINGITKNAYGLTYLSSSGLTAGASYDIVRVYWE